MHFRAICTLFANTYEGLLCASFDSEVLLETHLRAFGTTKRVVFCATYTCVNRFGGVPRCAPPYDPPIICEYLFAAEVSGDSGLYNTK